MPAARRTLRTERCKGLACLSMRGMSAERVRSSRVASIRRVVERRWWTFLGEGFLRQEAMAALSIRAWRRKTVTGCGMTSPFWGTDAGRGLNGTDTTGLPVQRQRGPGGRHYSLRKVVRNRRNEWVFSEMYAGGCYETHQH